jgi:hypothetical protein
MTTRTSLVKAVVGYSLLRAALLIGDVLVLFLLPRAFGVEVPLLVAVLLGLVVQLPMAWLLFPGQRHRVSALLAARSGTRVDERARLRAALAGDDVGRDKEDGVDGVDGVDGLDRAGSDDVDRAGSAGHPD